MSLRTRGANVWGLALSHMTTHMTKRLRQRGVHAIFSKMWVLNFINWICLYISTNLNGIRPCFEDLEPILRPDFGRKLGCDPQLKSYVNPSYFTWKTCSENENDE
jgi:hypothetical protein